MTRRNALAALALAALIPAAGCGGSQTPDHDEQVVPVGAIPAPPEGSGTSPTMQQSGDPGLPSGRQLPGEPALQNGAAGAVQTDTPRATDAARVRPGGS